MFDVAMTIANARSEVATDAAGVLSLKTRKQVWNALAAGLDERVALAARVKLDALCVRRVMAVWASRFDPDEIESMLSLAEAVVAGTANENDAARTRDRFYTDVVDDRAYGSDPSALYVGHAAANTVIEAMTPSHADECRRRTMMKTSTPKAICPVIWPPAQRRAA
jgi:hypothetical protein